MTLSLTEVRQFKPAPHVHRVEHQPRYGGPWPRIPVCRCGAVMLDTGWLKKWIPRWR